MKNKEIYEGALRLLAQSSDGADNSDYEERAPYLIASFCHEVFELDCIARKLLALPLSAALESVTLPLNEDFPLLERFASAAMKYLAAMLVIDEDSELSDKLYDMYCDCVSRIREELPAAIENIVNKYI